MSDHDNIEEEKTQLELDREQLQDEAMEHHLGKENELRRKHGLREIPFYLKDDRTPEQIKTEKQKKAEALRRVVAKYLKQVNENI